MDNRLLFFCCYLISSSTHSCSHSFCLYLSQYFFSKIYNIQSRSTSFCCNLLFLFIYLFIYALCFHLSFSLSVRSQNKERLILLICLFFYSYNIVKYNSDFHSHTHSLLLFSKVFMMNDGNSIRIKSSDLFYLLLLLIFI